MDAFRKDNEERKRDTDALRKDNEERKRDTDALKKDIEQKANEQQKLIDGIREELDATKRLRLLGQAAIDAEAALLFAVGGKWAEGRYEWDPQQKMWYFSPFENAKRLHVAFLHRKLPQEEATAYTQFLYKVYGRSTSLNVGDLSNDFSGVIRSAKKVRLQRADRRVSPEELLALIKDEHSVATWQAIIHGAGLAPRYKEVPEQTGGGDEEEEEVLFL
jgi:hypothetical protein